MGIVLSVRMEAIMNILIGLSWQKTNENYRYSL